MGPSDRSANPWAKRASQQTRTGLLRSDGLRNPPPQRKRRSPTCRAPKALGRFGVEPIFSQRGLSPLKPAPTAKTGCAEFTWRRQCPTPFRPILKSRESLPDHASPKKTATHFIHACGNNQRMRVHRRPLVQSMSRRRYAATTEDGRPCRHASAPCESEEFMGHH